MSLALCTANNGWRRQLDEATLVRCLKGSPERLDWPLHLDQFFAEVSLPVLDRFMARHGLTATELLAVLDALPDAPGPSAERIRAWLDEQHRTT